MNKPVLKVDWATYEAAKYACENWHYSKCVPKFKQNWIGVWENSKFIGVISFGRSSTPYLGTAYGLDTTECVELTRIALTKHLTPVSRIMSLAFKFIKRRSPGIRLFVTLADPLQNHYGGVYQATNWIYVGLSSANTQYFYGGKWRNDSSLMRMFQTNKALKASLQKRNISGKFKYLMPLDDEMRKRIAPLAQPYPKRVKKQDSERPSELGGAVPTDTLQNAAVNTEE